MKHFTSYYANFFNIPKNYACVAISRKCPDFFIRNENAFFFNENIIAPSDSLLKDAKSGNINDDEYKKRYLEEFFYNFAKNGNWTTVTEWIESIDSEFKDYDAIVFMCYESPEKFCHRHIFSAILKYYNIECHEFSLKDIENNEMLF